MEMPPRERNPVIVFACARTGSTILLRILNCLPNTIVWGEHGGFLTPWFHSYLLAKEMVNSDFVKISGVHLHTLLNRDAVPGGDGMTIEWVNWLQEGDIDRIYRKFLHDTFLPLDYREHFWRWGFKEIRYGMHEYACLKALYPGFAPIVILRHPIDVLISQFNNITPNDPTSFATHVAATEDFFRFARNISAASLVIFYEHFCQSPKRCCAILEEYLSEEFDPAPLSALLDEVSTYRNDSNSLTLGTFKQWLNSKSINIPYNRFESIIADYDYVLRLTK